jgi:hypothetical protein
LQTQIRLNQVILGEVTIKAANNLLPDPQIQLAEPHRYWSPFHPPTIPKTAAAGQFFVPVKFEQRQISRIAAMPAS